MVIKVKYIKVHVLSLNLGLILFFENHKKGGLRRSIADNTIRKCNGAHTTKVKKQLVTVCMLNYS